MLQSLKLLSEDRCMSIKRNSLKFLSRTALAFVSIAFVAGCSGQSWEGIEIKGSTTTFSMPHGYRHNPLGGGHQYQGKKGDATFKVVVYPRTEQAQDQAAHISDEMKIQNFAREIMGPVLKELKSNGSYRADRYDGCIQNENGYTVQYTVAAGDRTVYSRFYITPQVMFYVEAAADDPKNPDVADFFDMFKP